MKKLFDYIKTNLLIKVASLNTVSIGIKILAGFFTSKVIAVFIGSEGLALIGNLRDFLRAVQSFSTLGLYNGVVKYIAEFRNNTKELAKTLATSYYLGFTATIIAVFLCYFNAEAISSSLFNGQTAYAYVIKILAVALPFYALNVYIFSILNGFSKYKMLLVINIIGQVLTTLVTIFLIWYNNIDGALIALVIAESLLVLITGLSISSQKSLVHLLQFKNFSFPYVKKLSTYAAMALFSAFVLPIIAIAIRSYIIDNVSQQAAGFWEAMTRISRYYLMFVSSLLTLYILPRLSAIDNVKGFRKEIFSFYKTIIPLFAFGLIVIYLLRNFIITLIFTKEFAPVEDLFFWQLLGDFIKVLSIVIAYQFLAKNMFWHYIIIEAFSLALMYFSSIYLIDEYGVKGVTIAHFVTYVVHYIIILIIFSKALFGKIPEHIEQND